MNFTIIIPTLNEAQAIVNCLTALQPLRNFCEIIVVDGGSADNTKRLAQPFADKVMSSAKGRAIQMNIGAESAKGDVLIFLHADTFLPDDALGQITQASNNKAKWGRCAIEWQSSHAKCGCLVDELAFPSYWDCYGRSGYFRQ